jgi:site-specific recombinase XerD
MRNESSLGILFFIRKERGSDDKKAAIYLRITVNGKRAELSIKREVEIEKWVPEAGKAKGTKEDVRQLNDYIALWERKTYQSHKDLIEEEVSITAEAIKNRLLGRYETQKTLVEVFEYHNRLLSEKVNIDHALGTWLRYETTLKHVKDFMTLVYKQNDISLSKLNYKFATDLEHYLITVRRCNQNSTSKYIKNLKHVIKIALKNEWIDKDPFINFKSTVRPVDRGFLTPEELQILEEKEISIPRINQVRDIFVFSCYTGLAYVDVLELTPDNIKKGIDGELWITIHRHKTDIASNIPLLPKAVEIISKYRDHPVAVQKGVLLPVLSNQKLNSYLKEIADICDIKKNITFHLARHTFATTVTLTNGVPIESVSSMLGHTNIKKTQIYAKVIQKKVSDDMKALKQKLLDVRISKKGLNQN